MIIAEIFVRNVDGRCAGGWKSSMAIDIVRAGGGIAHINVAEESGADAVLALVSGVAEISDSVFIAGWDWRAAWMAARVGRG